MAGRNLRPPPCLTVQQSLYQHYSSLPYRCIGFKNKCKSTHFLRYGKIKLLRFSEVLEKQQGLSHGVCPFGSLKKKIFHVAIFLYFCILKTYPMAKKNSMTETDVSLCDNFKSIKQEIFNHKYHRKPIDHNIHSLIKALNKYVERNLEKTDRNYDRPDDT